MFIGNLTCLNGLPCYASHVTLLARFYGGFMLLGGEASITCEGDTKTGNYAGEQGGGVYAQQAEWVDSSCDLIANESPKGAAIYLTNMKSAMFEDYTSQVMFPLVPVWFT